MVSVVRVKEGYKTAIYNALDMIKTYNLSNVDSILVKPNLCHYFSPDTGITTDVMVVEYLIDYIRSRINDKAKIIIGEADATEMKVDIAFKLLGFEKLARRKKVNLLNLSRDRKLRVTGKYIKEIPATVREVDLLITVPKLKTHSDVKLTCCLKNQFGAIPYWKKSVFHKNLETVIIEAARFMKPDICLVDGIIALEGVGPISQGKPLRMNLIIAGNDPVATDFICSKIMGLGEIKYIKLAEKEGIGSTKNLEILGEKLELVKRKFKRVPVFLHLAKNATKLGLGSAAFLLQYFHEKFSKEVK